MNTSRRARTLAAALLLTVLAPAVAGLAAAGPASAATSASAAASTSTEAGTGIEAAAAALKKGPVYVDPRARAALSAADAKALAAKIEDKGKPVFVAVVPAADEYPADSLLRSLRSAVGVSGVYAVVRGDRFDAAADARVMSPMSVRNLGQLAQDTHPGDAGAQLESFVGKAVEQARGRASGSWAGGGGDGLGTGALIGTGAVLVAAGGGAVALRRSARRRAERQEREQLEQLRTVVDEDITAFGEELDRLDFHPAEDGATDAMREDYGTALDAYEDAKRKMAAARRPGDVKPVTESLQDGRFALAALDARREGRALPERRMPCFFDPRHGPSVRDVAWAPAGGAVREVPACAADAARVASGADPEMRTVQTENGPQPYWNAGPAYTPWAGGYFGGMLPGFLMGTMLGHMMAGPAMWGGADTGAEGGDFTGGDFDGGDFGGFGGGFGDL
ncbi:hypothetical protein BIV57_03350 [Mangrovactinospora gilvigrisea]|uniref:DUF5129 domain-containing protein n=1 Tax=Mangrovactinospora gilvigrisea TaxID=1428644 RepID=A0A1J7CGK4_9ACTN|nr:hypothetical protein [Mangrovactinospora gilvigrisea]OIV38794.1 hypothetical protein BIV57_03350 [Mangrovactinospora gilvigrisea]